MWNNVTDQTKLFIFKIVNLEIELIRCKLVVNEEYENIFVFEEFQELLQLFESALSCSTTFHFIVILRTQASDSHNKLF